MNNRASRLCVGFAAVGFLALPAHSQWTTQTVALRPGWNAVFLEIEPEPKRCDQLFAGMPVESAWAWNRRFSSVQFIQDPETLVPGHPDWLIWLPSNHSMASTKNLFTLEAGRTYLIKVADGAAALNMQINGRAAAPGVQWLSDSVNLAGFQLQTQAPTFGNFFGGSAAHAGQPIYRLNTLGRWEPVVNPSITPMSRGEAFWIHCRGHSGYAGPLQIILENSTGLDFGRVLTEQRVRIRNESSSQRSVTLRQLASAAPPNPSFPEMVGPVPLSYFKMNLTNNEHAWLPFPSQLERLDMAPGDEWLVRLAVRRADMAAYSPSPNQTSLYQSLLEITDDFGFRRVVPVTAEGLQASGATPSLGGLSAQTTQVSVSPRAGLWVGSAKITKINQPSSIGQPHTPVGTPAPFPFRLLIHVNAEGQARLLQKVLQMWKNGTTKPDPNDPTKQIVDVPGRFVLLTAESFVPNFSGSVLRDGDPVGRRISSSAFSFRDPIVMTGSGQFGANTVSCAVTLNYNDPLNPFKHQYHPDHDNLDERFEQNLPEGIESFTITRVVQLQFQATDPENLQLAGWGDNQLGGVYRETITGLHQKTLYLEGTFRLHQASRIPVLNDVQ
jgi:hypothetical protein